MKTKSLIAAFIILVGLLTYSTVLKIKENSEQSFHVITWKKYDICFLIPDSFKIEKDKTGFQYIGGENSGHLVLSQGSISSDYIKTTMGDFKAGYKKTVNLRLFQYEIQPGVILSDTFDFAKRKPANIISVRKNCGEYLKRFSVSIEL